MITIKIEYLGNINYFEDLMTGFYELSKKNRDIIFQYRTEKWKSYLRHFITRVNTRLLNFNLPSNFRTNNRCLLKVIVDQRCYRIALDCMDTLWEFFESSLEPVDFYYKFQCPIDIEKGYYDLNASNRYFFSDAVLENLGKIKPLCVMHPLSRKMNFKENLKVLSLYEKRRYEKKRNTLSWIT